MAKKYGKRSRYGNRYVARNAKGRFISNVDVGRSLKADRRRDAKNYAGPGFGQMGDASSKKRAEHSQGYNDRDDESIGGRHRGKHKQSMKDRRDESKGMTNRWNRHHPYADVSTMSAEMPVPQNYPEGDGRILGQSDSTTNYTPAGLHAETFLGGAKQGFGVTMGVLGALMVGGFAMNMLGMASGDTSDE